MSSPLYHTVQDSKETEERCHVLVKLSLAQPSRGNDDAGWLRRGPIESHKQTQQNRSDLSKILEALEEELKMDKGKKKKPKRSAVN